MSEPLKKRCTNDVHSPDFESKMDDHFKSKTKERYPHWPEKSIRRGYRSRALNYATRI